MKNVQFFGSEIGALGQTAAFSIEATFFRPKLYSQLASPPGAITMLAFFDP